MFRPSTFAPLGIGLFCLIGGCQPISDEGAACQRDEDCAELCSRIGDCLSAQSAIEVRLSWTVSGLSPSPSTPEICGAIEALEVRFESDSLREPVIYYPVPCELGRVYYDRMPDHLRQIQVSAVDRSNAILDVVIRNLESSSNDFVVDLIP